MDEKLIEKNMALLNISREEAIAMMADDEAIDKGEKLFELTKEQEKNAKEARQVARSVGVSNKREHKAKPEKIQICESLRNGLADIGITDFNITNAEREFLFHFNGVKYKVTLACPRS